MTNSIFTQENKELVVLADLAYQDSPIERYGDWEIKYTSDQVLTNLTTDQKEGYFGIAAKNVITGEIKVIHRGSDQLLPIPGTNLDDDLDDDLAINRNQIPDQYLISRQFVNIISELENTPKSQINEAGQSLGGYLAKLGAIENGTKAFAVSSPTLGDAVYNLEIFNGVALGTYSNQDYSDKIFSVNNTKDDISSGSRQETIGKIATFTPIDSSQPIAAPGLLEIFEDIFSLSSPVGLLGKINLVATESYLAVKYGIVLGESGAAKIDELFWNHSIDATIAEFDRQIGSSSKLPTPSINQEVNFQVGDNFYTIKSGDTISQIASLYNLTTEELIASNEWLIDENRISSDSSYALIKPGERLTIPEEAVIDKNSDYYNELKSSLSSLISEDTSLTSLNSEDKSELSNITDLLGSDELTTFSEAIKSTLEEQLQQSLPSSSITDFLNTYFSEGNRNDILKGGAGNDYLDGGAGNDYLDGGEGNDEIDGGGGNDEIHGGERDDRIIGGAGNDYLIGGNGNDVYVYNKGDGIDVISSEYRPNWYGYDKIVLGEGINKEEVYFSTDSEGSLNIKFRGNESDQINIRKWAWDVAELEFADGEVIDLRDIPRDSITPGSLLDLIGISNHTFEYEGTAGDDYIYARGTTNVINGGAGNDRLSGSGDNIYVYNKGDGEDSIAWYREGDVIEFGEGIKREDIYFSTGFSTAFSTYSSEYFLPGSQESLNIKFRGSESDQINIVGLTSGFGSSGVLKFADGTEISLTDLSNHVFEYQGTAGDDNILAYDNAGANHMIDGGAGNDYIYSGGGNDDRIIGGVGNDILLGRDGDDIYVYNKGDGDDSIDDDIGSDVIEFGEGISREDIYFSRIGDYNNNDLVINFKNNASDKITIYKQLNTFYSCQIEKLRFADGSELDIAKESDLIFNYIGSDNSDMIESGYGKNIIEGLGGDDKIYSGHNNDVIDGGSGNDKICAGEGDDIIIGGVGDDYLVGEWGDDVLKGGVGNDDLDAREGDDIIIGGVGNDYLVGGHGDDVYVYNKGDGEDNIVEIGGNDKIIFGEGISKEDVYFNQVASGYDVKLMINFKDNVADRINIVNWNWDNAKVEILEFADGGMLDIVEMVKNMNNGGGSTSGGADSSTGQDGDVLLGGKGNDILKGKGGGDIFRGGNGEDKIKGEDGDDRIKGGGGRDVLQGGEGSDEIEGGKGSDLLKGGRGDDILKGDEGNDILEGGAGSDTLKGGKGSDILNGGWGIDMLSGGEGKDVFLFNSLSESKNDGLDVILDFIQNEDKIDLSALDFDSISKWNGAATSDHNLEYYFKNGNTIIEDQHSNFAVKLAGEIQLDNNDFIF